uniref:Sperm-associated antigen 8 n=1 Tax=Cairina moschata TaxID=8855 RepID=A0A8C3CKC5_CAIMO
MGSQQPQPRAPPRGCRHGRPPAPPPRRLGPQPSSRGGGRPRCAAGVRREAGQDKQEAPAPAARWPGRRTPQSTAITAQGPPPSKGPSSARRPSRLQGLGGGGGERGWRPAGSGGRRPGPALPLPGRPPPPRGGAEGARRAPAAPSGLRPRTWTERARAPLATPPKPRPLAHLPPPRPTLSTPPPRLSANGRRPRARLRQSDGEDGVPRPHGDGGGRGRGAPGSGHGARSAAGGGDPQGVGTGGAAGGHWGGTGEAPGGHWGGGPGVLGRHQGVFWGVPGGVLVTPPGAGVTQGAGVTGGALGDVTPLSVPARRVALTGCAPPGHGGDPRDEPPPRTVRLRGDVLLPVGASCRGDAAGEPPGGVVVDGGEELGADEEQQEEQEAAAEELPGVLAVATEPPAEVPAPMPAQEPRQSVPRGSCLIHNWQEERATNDLDQVPAPEMGSEGFVHRHGHRGLLTRQPPAQPPPSTTTKHAFRPPHSVPMLARGQREAMLELMLYQKYRQELLQEMSPPRAPMESLSTTHRDFQAGGFQPTPLPTTQPHDYHTEQPCSFWLEQARSVPGVTCIRTGDSPFRRNAAFSTPITEYLEQPLPHVAESYGVRPSKQ